jgi:enamine deaminase RidA (YjgF/YER057c/UK114 family)
MAEGGPAPAGPYSHAVVSGGFVFVSGQGPVDPATGKMPDGFADQVRQTLENLQTILEAAGSSLDGVVKVNAYVTDLLPGSQSSTKCTRSFSRTSRLPAPRWLQPCSASS